MNILVCLSPSLRGAVIKNILREAAVRLVTLQPLCVWMMFPCTLEDSRTQLNVCLQRREEECAEVCTNKQLLWMSEGTLVVHQHRRRFKHPSVCRGVTLVALSDITQHISQFIPPVWRREKRLCDALNIVAGENILLLAEGNMNNAFGKNGSV